MTDDDLFTLLRRALLAAQPDLRLEGFGLDTSFAEIGLESVSLLEVAAIVETRLGLTFADEAVFGVSTGREFIDLVRRSGSGASAPE